VELWRIVGRGRVREAKKANGGSERERRERRIDSSIVKKRACKR
jgi:hypothetical protein